MKHFTRCLSLAILILPSYVHAIRIKISQRGSANTVVAAGTSTRDVLEDKSGVLKVNGRTAQLTVLSSTGPLSVIYAYKIGSEILAPKTVLKSPSKYCVGGKAKAYSALKASSANVRLTTRSEGDVAYYTGTLNTSSTTSLSTNALTNLVSVDDSCLPAGNGLSEGLGSATTVATRAAKLSIDQDGDGLFDGFDSDIDGDGVLNNFDSGFTIVSGSFRVFSNLKVGIENTLNVNAFGREPTRAEVDTLTNGTTLAIEVKATGTDVSELNCKSLGYCSAGGTGQVLGTTNSFPGTAGGTFDSDSDGNGTITAGSTGDFQLDTNLSAFNELNAGDGYVQTVSNSSGTLSSLYVASLQFAYRATPALKSLIIDPTGTPSTYNFSYPIAAGSAGTPSNCISVTPNSDGKIFFDVTAWRPQRKGIAFLGEADFVDLGNSIISVDIPNAPAISSSIPGAGPGLCPAATYTTSDTNLSASAEGLQDSAGDKDASVANTLSFRFELTECLAKNGSTLDAGEEVKLDLQFRNSIGDNAAVAFCVKRPTP